jgi:hypothetical protein
MRAEVSWAAGTILTQPRKPRDGELCNQLILVVSRLGLEPRALALKGLIRLLGLEAMESDRVREIPREDG